MEELMNTEATSLGIQENAAASTIKKCQTKPEGGLGFLVTFSFGLTMFLQFGMYSVLGIFYKDFLIEISGSSIEAFEILMTVNTYSIIFSGLGCFAVNLLLKRFTPRQICLFGAFLFTLGDVITLFMKTTAHFFIGFSIFKGVALGLINPTNVVVLNGYFARLRTTMMSLAAIFACIGGVVLPPLVAYLMTSYGLRGSLMILMSLNTHLVFGGLSMLVYKLDDNKMRSEKKRGNMDTENVDISCRYQPVKTIEDEDAAQINKCIRKDMHIGNRKSFMHRAGDALELDLVRDPIFMNIVIGLSLTMFTETIYQPGLPMILFAFGYDENDSAFLTSVGSAVDLLTKLTTAAAAYYVPLNNRILFYIASLLTSIFRTVLIQSKNYTHIFLCNILICAMRAWLQITMFLVIVDHVKEKRFAAGTAIFAVVFITNLVLGNYLIGVVREGSGDFHNVVYVINIFNAVCILSWTIEYVLRSRKRLDKMI